MKALRGVLSVLGGRPSHPWGSVFASLAVPGMRAVEPLGDPLGATVPASPEQKAYERDRLPRRFGIGDSESSRSGERLPSRHQRRGGLGAYKGFAAMGVLAAKPHGLGAVAREGWWPVLPGCSGASVDGKEGRLHIVALQLLAKARDWRLLSEFDT
jgi:hypothetical protein